jgi:hypothetical protein
MRNEVIHTAKAAVREAAPWVVKLARFGYLARGFVYVLVGVLAGLAAVGERGRPEGTRGTLLEIFRHPGGQLLLGAIAAGLAGFAIWRVVQALLDPERKGTGAVGIGKRIGYLVSAFIHGGLAATAAKLALGERVRGGEDAQARSWTARLMEAPAGRWLVVLAGAGILAYGVWQLWRAWKSDLAKRLDLARLSPEAREWTVRAARVGVASRGVVSVILGLFVVRAGLAYDPGKARGLEGALQSVREKAYGPWLLGAVAAGLAAFGIFEIMKARFRRIHPA